MNSFVSRWNPTQLLMFGKNATRVLSNAVVQSNGRSMVNIGARSISVSSRLHGQLFEYTVSFKTGNVVGAGTDARVYIRMIGATGSSDEIMLKTGKKDFVRGSLDHFTLPSDDVGALKKFIIRHDNTGLAPGWYLEWVKVKDGHGKDYHFDCNAWLAKGEKSKNIKLLKAVEEAKIEVKE